MTQMVLNRSIREITRTPLSGWLMFPVLLAGTVGTIYLGIENAEEPARALFFFFISTVIAFCFAGLFVVNPNEARVLTLFGRYAGTVKVDGFHWMNPLMIKRRISQRIVSLET